MKPAETHETLGQQRAAGNAMVGLGALALIVALVLFVLHVELSFIEARAMAGFALLMIGVGAWQRSQPVRELGPHA